MQVLTRRSVLVVMDTHPHTAEWCISMAAPGIMLPLQYDSSHKNLANMSKDMSSYLKSNGSHMQQLVHKASRISKGKVYRLDKSYNKNCKGVIYMDRDANQCNSTFLENRKIWVLTALANDMIRTNPPWETKHGSWSTTAEWKNLHSTFKIEIHKGKGIAERNMWCLLPV